MLIYEPFKQFNSHWEIIAVFLFNLSSFNTNI